MKLNVYLLRQIGYVGYDEYKAKVILASNVPEARKIANTRVVDEGKIWEDPRKTSCEKVSLDYPGVILEAFKAG